MLCSPELSLDADLDSLVKKIKETKDLEILVNNAGFANPEFFHEADISTWENMLKVHALATMKLSHAALPIMIANKNGSIINVSSILAYGPFSKFTKNAMYCATKGFINILTESLYVGSRTGALI